MTQTLGDFMNFLDVVTFVLGTSAVMMVFVSRTNLEKSRVRVKVKSHK